MLLCLPGALMSNRYLTATAHRSSRGGGSDSGLAILPVPSAELRHVCRHPEISRVQEAAGEVAAGEERYWHAFNDLGLQLGAHLQERDATLAKARPRPASPA